MKRRRRAKLLKTLKRIGRERQRDGIVVVWPDGRRERLRLEYSSPRRVA